MKFGTKIIVGFVCIGALSLAYYGNNIYEKKEADSNKEKYGILSFNKDHIVRFELENKEGRFVFSRPSVEKPWSLEFPLEARGDAAVINRSLESLQNIHVQQIQEMHEASTQKKYLGLNPPVLKIDLQEQGGRTHKISIGSSLDVPTLENKNPGRFGAFSSYAVSFGRKELFIIDNSNISDLNTKSLKDFRDKRIGDFIGSLVGSINIATNSENFRLVETNSSWYLKDNNKLISSNMSFINSFKQYYQGLFADSIIEKSDLKSLAIDPSKPAASISFFSKEGPLLQEFKLYITKEFVYVALPHQGFGRLDLNRWPELVPAAKKFKDKQFLSGIDIKNIQGIKISDKKFYRLDDKMNAYLKSKWPTDIVSGEAPSQIATAFFKATFELQADDVLYEKNVKNPLYGLEKPLKTFSILWKDKNKDPVKVSIGRRVVHDEKNAYVSRSDSQQIYIIDSHWLDQLAQL